MSKFKVSVSSRFEELWRYNVDLVCELCSADGERVEFLSQESHIAPVGSNLAAPPVDYDCDRTLKCECRDGDYLNILVYVIPHTLPVSNTLAQIRHFPLTIKVEKDGKGVLSRAFEINQWSGDNIALQRVGADE